jgi:hypothetical protein
MTRSPIRVVKGAPTHDELAALTAVLMAQHTTRTASEEEPPPAGPHRRHAWRHRPSYRSPAGWR